MPLKGLIGFVVGEVFSKLVEPTSVLLEYFNGGLGIHPNYTGDSDAEKRALEHLAGQLVAFFGEALGCSDGSIPSYTDANVVGVSLKEFHDSMPISIFEFNAFNGQGCLFPRGCC
jgi:hypothetical protein